MAEEENDLEAGSVYTLHLDPARDLRATPVRHLSPHALNPLFLKPYLFRLLLDICLMRYFFL